jgi:cyclopropane fatty-acyl-phospholipid synthase-like methyltransferase
MSKDMYVDGAYLKKNPEWHVEESAWKASQINRMLIRQHLVPRTICEVGCGAGEVLKQVQNMVEDTCVLWGYDISPQAIELCTPRANERLHFKLADVVQEQGAFFDLMLILDVVEHLEDYFSFLRALQPKSEHKILHIPLDLSVQTVLRQTGLLHVHSAYGHLHYFTKETALQMLRDAGYKVLDYFYTSRSIEIPTTLLGRRLLNLPRKWLFTINQDIAAHVLGGFSLLVLAT